MAENGALAEAQALRGLISGYHRQDEQLALATWQADGPALRKFQAYFSQVFLEEQRQERLTAIGILIGREIDTTVPGLTIGEVSAFLTWLKDERPGYQVRKGARRLLEAMCNQRQVRVFLRAHLGKIELRRIYAETKQEDDTAWISPPPYQNEMAVPF